MDELVERARREQVTGTEARAQWLRNRLRTATLTPLSLELAAYCGDPAARLIATPENKLATWMWGQQFDHGEWTPRSDALPPGEWAFHLDRWGLKAVVLAGVAALEEAIVRSCCPTGCAACAWSTRQPSAEACLRSVVVWLAHPSEKHRADVTRHLEDPLHERQYWWAHVAAAVLFGYQTVPVAPAPLRVPGASFYARTAVQYAAAQAECGFDQVVRAIRARLLDYALDEGALLEERLEEVQ